MHQQNTPWKYACDIYETGTYLFVCGICMFTRTIIWNMANVSTHDNRAYATYKTYEIHILVLRRVVQ
jgi:hypothetical protein